jgi:hypothetical protein
MRKRIQILLLASICWISISSCSLTQTDPLDGGWYLHSLVVGTETYLINYPGNMTGFSFIPLSTTPGSGLISYSGVSLTPAKTTGAYAESPSPSLFMPYATAGSLTITPDGLPSIYSNTMQYSVTSGTLTLSWRSSYWLFPTGTTKSDGTAVGGNIIPDGTSVTGTFTPNQ